MITIPLSIPFTARSGFPSQFQSPARISNGVPANGATRRSANVPSPKPRSSDTVCNVLEKLVTAKSRWPSRLKSATATSRGACPASSSRRALKVPPPCPRNRETVAPLLFGTTKSSLPSPFRSAIFTFWGVETAARVAPSSNDPSPRPRRIATLASTYIAIARSSCPSPLRSPTAIEEGPLPASVKFRAASSVPSPWPRKIEAVAEGEWPAATMSGRPSELKSPIATASNEEEGTMYGGGDGTALEGARTKRSKLDGCVEIPSDTATVTVDVPASQSAGVNRRLPTPAPAPDESVETCAKSGPSILLKASG